MRTASVIRKYTSSNPNPIHFTVGDELVVGEVYDDNPNWKDWVKCKAVKNGAEGWVPLQLIKIESNHAVALEDYSANELTVDVGIKVEIVKSLNGWTWCQTVEGEEGWLPNEVLED